MLAMILSAPERTLSTLVGGTMRAQDPGPWL